MIVFLSKKERCLIKCLCKTQREHNTNDIYRFIDAGLINLLYEDMEKKMDKLEKKLKLENI